MTCCRFCKEYFRRFDLYSIYQSSWLNWTNRKFVGFIFIYLFIFQQLQCHPAWAWLGHGWAVTTFNTGKIYNVQKACHAPQKQVKSLWLWGGWWFYTKPEIGLGQVRLGCYKMKNKNKTKLRHNSDCHTLFEPLIFIPFYTFQNLN